MRQPNLYQEALFQGRLWSPAALPPFAWWDGADISTVAQSGGVITQWSDKSGNGRHATGGAATYSIETFNGLNTVSFNGSTNLNITAPGNDAVGILAVVRPTVDGGGTGLYRGICATNTAGNSGSMLLAKVPLDGQWGTFGSSANNPSSGYLLANTSYILTMTRSSSDTGRFFQSGADVGSYTTTEGQSAAQTIGGASGFGQGFTGSICELIWTAGELTFELRTAAEGYLSWKWGIPLAADHPFANRPPLIGG